VGMLQRANFVKYYKSNKLEEVFYLIVLTTYLCIYQCNNYTY
jgi:hypothetical protein